MTTLADRHADKIVGVLSCLDRVVIAGTLPDICHREGGDAISLLQKVRTYDCPGFTKPLRDQFSENASGISSGE